MLQLGTLWSFRNLVFLNDSEFLVFSLLHLKTFLRIDVGCSVYPIRESCWASRMWFDATEQTTWFWWSLCFVKITANFKTIAVRGFFCFYGWSRDPWNSDDLRNGTCIMIYLLRVCCCLYLVVSVDYTNRRLNWDSSVYIVRRDCVRYRQDW